MPIPPGSISNQLIRLILHTFGAKINQSQYDSCHMAMLAPCNTRSLIDLIYRHYCYGLDFEFNLLNNACRLALSKENYLGIMSTTFLKNKIQNLNTLLKGILFFNLQYYSSTTNVTVYDLHINATNSKLTWNEVSNTIDTLLTLYDA